MEAERPRAFVLIASERSHFPGVPALLCLGDGSAGLRPPRQPGTAVGVHHIQADMGKKPVGS